MATVKAVTALVRPVPQRVPVLTTQALGKGKVVFCADPLELSKDSTALRGLYRWFLADAGIAPLPVSPPKTPRIARVPDADPDGFGVWCVQPTYGV